jgi:hypothetical protein
LKAVNWEVEANDAGFTFDIRTAGGIVIASGVSGATVAPTSFIVPLANRWHADTDFVQLVVVAPPTGGKFANLNVNISCDIDETFLNDHYS